jgi:hypothetical protein
MKRVLLLVVAALISAVSAGAFAQTAISITDDSAGIGRHGTDANRWRWRVAPVNQSAEHFELRYGSADQDWDKWLLVARVGQPVNGVFPVEFVSQPGRANEQALTSARQQIDYYLMEVGARDPWEYAAYHATTLANLYSRVHWLHVQPRSRT